MNHQRSNPFGPTPASVLSLLQRNGPALLVCLLTLLSACSANRSDSVKGQRMRLTVGDISEVTISARADTTWQLTATSDNQEVVDVSRKSTDTVAPNSPQLTMDRPVVYLIKGVTAGTARVVFSEKPVGEDGSGRVRKAYVVTVMNK